MADFAAPGTPNRASTRTPSSRPASTRSTPSPRPSSRTSDESTPLLARDNSGDRPDHDESEDEGQTPATASLLRSIHSRAARAKRKWPWPSIIALLLLCIFTVAIMLVGFFVPEALEEYALQAKEFEITSLSLPEFTATGARARIQGTFWMNADKVRRKSVRDLGILGTWIAREIETRESKLEVTLPDYDGVLIGTAVIPPIKVNIRNGNKNSIDILADLDPGDVEGVRRVANDWLDGNLDSLKVQGRAAVKLRSGIISLPMQTIMQSMVFQGNQIPAIPQYNISRLNFHETNLTDGAQGMEADVSITVKNDYPLDLAVPPLSFGILVDGCLPVDPRIMVADATIANLRIHPKEDLQVNATGVVRHLPDALTAACPGSDKSPLDALLGGYMHGKETTVYVTGSDSPSLDTPKWIVDLASSITVPIPLPGRAFGGLVRNFSLSDVHFSLPDPLAQPDSPESQPQISAKINVLVALPEEMNFNLDVDKVRAKAKVYYKGKTLGRLDLHKWQPANSTRIEPHGEEQQPTLLVESAVEEAPLEIQDQDVFSEVMQALIFGSKTVLLTIKAEVDVQVETALGEMTVRQVPAEGIVPVKPIDTGRGFKTFNPKVGNLQILDTTNESLTIQAEANFTNPTQYSASVPYVDVNILVNNTILGHATARNVSMIAGNNTGLVIQAIWNPHSAGGTKGQNIGRELLSQYISGYNTTLTLKTHEGTIPAQPTLGKALEALKIVIPTPRLNDPDTGNGDDDPDHPDNDGKPHFIRGATMHVFSSTVEFNLLSPLSHTSLYITFVNATAFYKQDDVGHIFYGEEFDGLSEEFEVPPGASITPRLPVDWSLGSVGYEALKKALGGTLKLSGEATVGIRVGQFRERVWYKGGGIGTHVKI